MVLNNKKTSVYNLKSRASTIQQKYPLQSTEDLTTFLYNLLHCYKDHQECLPVLSL